MGESLGIPNSVLARMLGFSGYGRYRLQKATEDEKYPELDYAAGVDTLQAESQQEKVEGEPGKKPAAAPAKKKLVVRKKEASE
jgi:hypothetical protein